MAIQQHLRLTHAYADSRDGALLNTSTPSTEINFDYPVGQINIPVISHEIGQYQIYPDYIVTEECNDKLITELELGAKVLLFPKAESVKNKSFGGLFPPDFWNYEMFKMISGWNNASVSPGTLGILTNPNHPIFNSFPTDSFTNWQWFSIIKTSRPLILDQTSAGYRPVVLVIDNLQRNNKLGLIFEFTVGKGKLLVCMARLLDILDKPEANQLYKSIISYMKSNKFSPGYSINKNMLYDLF